MPKGVYVRSEETRKKMSESARNRSRDHLEKISNALMGNKNGAGEISEETKKKISDALVGRTPSSETKRKMSEAKLGHKQSDETIKRRVAKNKGKKRSEEFKFRSSESRKGKRWDSNDAVGFWVNSLGYVTLTMQYDHPLAAENHCVYEHRKVLYDNIGIGPHQCNWGCGSILNWGENLEVDHLDGDPSNNELENLVSSCGSCNKKRANAGNPLDWRFCG